MSTVKGTVPVSCSTIKLGFFPFFSRLLSRPMLRPLKSLKLRMTVSVMLWRPGVTVAMWNLSVTRVSGLVSHHSRQLDSVELRPLMPLSCPPSSSTASIEASLPSSTKMDIMNHLFLH